MSGKRANISLSSLIALATFLTSIYFSHAEDDFFSTVDDDISDSTASSNSEGREPAEEADPTLPSGQSDSINVDSKSANTGADQVNPLEKDNSNSTKGDPKLLRILSVKMQELNVLEGLVKKQDKKSDDPSVLLRYAALLGQVADLERQTGTGNANLHSGQCDEMLTRILKKHAQYAKKDQVIYLRAKVREDLSNVNGAISDYKAFLSLSGNEVQRVDAKLRLGQLYAVKKDYSKMRYYLEDINAKPSDSFYVYWLQQLSYVYESLGNLKKSIQNQKRELDYYEADAKDKKSQDETTRLFYQIANSYYKGYAEKKPGFSLPGIFADFQELGENRYVSELIKSYGSLMRGRAKASEFYKWSELAYKRGAKYPGAFDVVLSAFENQVITGHNSMMPDTLKQIASLLRVSPTRRDETKAKLLAAETRILERIKKENDSTLKSRAQDSLMTVYESLLKFLDEKDPKQYPIHMNLAEAYYQKKEYNDSFSHYSIVAQAASGVTTEMKRDAELKALSVRYQHLKSAKKIPTQVVVLSLETNKPVPEILQKWIDSVDDYVKKYNLAPEIESFVFETNKAVYLVGDVQSGVDRLNSFVKKYPKSKYSEASASLVLDTAIKSRDWDLVSRLTKDYQKIFAGNNDKFAAGLKETAASADSKQIEIAYKKKDHQGVLKAADLFSKEYAKSKVSGTVFKMAGNSALALGDKPKALAYFKSSEKFGGGGGGDLSSTTVMLGASIAEESYDFSKAVVSYQRILAKKPGDEALQRKILYLSWLSGDSRLLSHSLQSKQVCTRALAKECSEYRGLLYLQLPLNARPPSIIQAALQKAQRGNPSERSIWAAIALQYTPRLNWNQRKLVLTTFAQSWNQMSPEIQLAILPPVMEHSGAAFAMYRKELLQRTPLKLDPNSIGARTQLLNELEQFAASLIQFPWARIYARITYSMSEMYGDTVNQLNGLIPKDISKAEKVEFKKIIGEFTQPFIQKERELAQLSMEKARDSSINGRDFEIIVQGFVKRFMKGKYPFHAELVPEAAFRWQKFIGYFEERATKLKGQKSGGAYSGLVASLKSKNLAQIPFYSNEIERQKGFQDGEFSLLSAISLNLAGAQSESIASYKKALADIENPELKGSILASLSAFYVNAYNKSAMQALADETDGSEKEDLTALSGEEALALLYGAAWSRNPLSGDIKQILAGRVNKSEVRASALAKKISSSSRSPASE